MPGGGSRGGVANDGLPGGEFDCDTLERCVSEFFDEVSKRAWMQQCPGFAPSPPDVEVEDNVLISMNSLYLTPPLPMYRLLLRRKITDVLGVL